MPPLLNGLTILRYGHVYDTGGGMERYLADLNRELLHRNNLHTIQVELTSQPDRVGEEEVALGTGRLRRVSLFVDQASHERAITGRHVAGRPRLKPTLRDRAGRLAAVCRLARVALARRPIPRRDGEPVDVGATVHSLHRRFPIDLICLHSAGSADVAEILAVAAAERIPAVYIHHFSNDRLAGLSMRSHIERLQGVAGVTGVAVPPFLRAAFRVVSDGIDAEYWRPDAARALARRSGAPLIFLPARITPVKGQADLIAVAGALRRRGLDFDIAFAGRVDTPAFMDDLRLRIHTEGLQGRVEFLGPVGPEQLRDWYAAASVVAFPTYHDEGLPRIALEAQAMMAPLVVYDAGGTSDGLQNERTGFLVRRGDRSRFEECLALLLQSPSLRHRMGNAGRRLVEERFTLAALADRHARFYLDVLAASLAGQGIRPLS